MIPFLAGANRAASNALALLSIYQLWRGNGLIGALDFLAALLVGGVAGHLGDRR